MLISASVAPPIRWINRCPAVMLAVNRTARAIGWIKRLIVSIITSIGISGVGVPCGKKWASDALVLLRNPVITAPAHRGMAMPRFIDSCVVGVNEWGNRPSRFVDPINRIRDININVHVCPLELWILIICFDTSWSIHCWRVTKRLLTSRFDVGNSRLGNSTIRVTRGRPKITGVIKEVNKYSFILFLKGCFVLIFLLVSVLDCDKSCVLKLLVERW